MCCRTVCCETKWFLKLNILSGPDLCFYYSTKEFSLHDIVIVAANIPKLLFFNKVC